MARPSELGGARVARRIESDPIVLLAATRDGYRSLLDDAGLPELRLGGLGGGAAGALLDACAPQLSLAARSPSRAWGRTCCSPRAQRIPTALRIGRRRPLQSAQRRFADADGQEACRGTEAGPCRERPGAGRRSMRQSWRRRAVFEIAWREASLAGAVRTPRNRCGPCSACWTARWRDAERTL